MQARLPKKIKKQREMRKIGQLQSRDLSHYRVVVRRKFSSYARKHCKGRDEIRKLNNRTILTFLWKCLYGSACMEVPSKKRERLDVRRLNHGSKRFGFEDSCWEFGAPNQKAIADLSNSGLIHSPTHDHWVLIKCRTGFPLPLPRDCVTVILEFEHWCDPSFF